MYRCGHESLTAKAIEFESWLRSNHNRCQQCRGRECRTKHTQHAQHNFARAVLLHGVIEYGGAPRPGCRKQAFLRACARCPPAYSGVLLPARFQRFPGSPHVSLPAVLPGVSGLWKARASGQPLAGEPVRVPHGAMDGLCRVARTRGRLPRGYPRHVTRANPKPKGGFAPVAQQPLSRHLREGNITLKPIKNLLVESDQRSSLRAAAVAPTQGFDMKPFDEPHAPSDEGPLRLPASQDPIPRGKASRRGRPWRRRASKPLWGIRAGRQGKRRSIDPPPFLVLHRGAVARAAGGTVRGLPVGRSEKHDRVLASAGPLRHVRGTLPPSPRRRADHLSAKAMRHRLSIHVANAPPPAQSSEPGEPAALPRAVLGLEGGKASWGPFEPPKKRHARARRAPSWGHPGRQSHPSSPSVGGLGWCAFGGPRGLVGCVVRAAP
eukprot:scaffold552_cov526-Prasinococcus_capsulatus_cf.AAC.2